MSGRPAGREGTPTRGTQLQKHHQVRDTVQRAQDDYEVCLFGHLLFEIGPIYLEITL
jgi:hypothetical protein